MNLFIFILFLLAPLKAFALHDYTLVNSTRESEALCQDFVQIFAPVGDNIPVIYREGTDRETSDGYIVERNFSISTLTWSPTVTTIYSKVGKDCTGPHGGTIGSTEHTFINCKTVPNSDGILVWGRRTVGSGAGGWTFSDLYTWPDVSTGSSSDLGSAWGKIIPTGTAGKYFIGISRGSTPAIQRLLTTDSGTSWAISGNIVNTPSKWSEYTGAYSALHGTIVGIVRDDTGANVSQVNSTDDGDTFSTPVAINLGQPTGIKVSYLTYEDSTDNFILVFCDRAESPDRVYVSVTRGRDAIAGRWNKAIEVDDSGFGNFDIYETNSAGKEYLIFSPDSGNGSCDLQFLVFKNKFPSNNLTGQTDTNLTIQ